MYQTIFQKSIPEFYRTIADTYNVPLSVVIGLVIVIATWSLVWKGLALWKSSKKNHLTWFIILLIVNTIGILEILYIYVFSEMKLSEPAKKKKKK